MAASLPESADLILDSIEQGCEDSGRSSATKIAPASSESSGPACCEEPMSAKQKLCVRCHQTKLLTEFHLQPSGPQGRHSWCKLCVNKYARETRNPNNTPEQRRRWNMSTRYGITIEQLNRMMESQNNLCAICEAPMKKPCVDHDHATEKIRGILCQPCNVKLATVEDRNYLTPALKYLSQWT